MKTSDFSYDIPASLVAQTPPDRRDASRLLVFHRGTGEVEDSRFSALPSIVRALRERTGAERVLFVANDSRVYPARVRVARASGARGEAFLLRAEGEGPWPCLLRPLKKLRVGEVLLLDAGGAPAFRIESLDPPLVSLARDGSGRGAGDTAANSLLPFLEAHGEMPLPPYIERDPRRLGESGGPPSEPVAAARLGAPAASVASASAPAAAVASAPSPHGQRLAALDQERYQTVYAGPVAGSAAAPTAGLHFTPEVIEACRAEGAEFRYVTLHVGLGTFAPVLVADPASHAMHEEWCVVPEALAAELEAVREEASRGETRTLVIYVGTTSLRAVESHFRSGARPGTWFPTRLFLYPGAEGLRGPEESPSAPLAVGDALLTNFHQPGSTLVMLVAALVGEDAWRPLYEHAIARSYRFFSYGDSSLLLFSGRLGACPGPYAPERSPVRIPPRSGGRA